MPRPLKEETHYILDSSFGADAGADGAHELHIDVIEATETPDFTEYFFRRQHACYSRFRSEAAAAPHQRRTSWKGVFFIVATDVTTGEIAGGVGLYERHPGSPLPVELVIGDTPQLRHALARWGQEQIAELSGLWVEEHWRRTGLSSVLMLAAMATARERRATKTVGFSHQHVLEFYNTIGLIPDHEVGEYHYPDHTYVSTFIWGDPMGLTTAPPEARAAIKQFARCMREQIKIVWAAVPRSRLVTRPNDGPRPSAP